MELILYCSNSFIRWRFAICILYKYWNVFGHITFCTGRQMNLFIHVEYIIFLICAAVGLATMLIGQWFTAFSNIFSLNRSLGSKRNFILKRYSLKDLWVYIKDPAAEIILFINEFLGVNFITPTWLVVLLAFQSCSTLYLVEWSMRCRINTPTTNTNMTNMVIEDKQNAGMINFNLLSSEIFLAVRDFGTVEKC